MNFPKHPTEMTYRADIDGIRAFAVIAVIAGHAFEDWFPGGYLGVDVFFVISGFVITRSLLARGGASFGSFFAAFSLRRIKRLLPALLVCIGLTCAVLLFLDAAPRTSLHTGAASLFGVSNFSLYFQELDYFSPSIKYNAFTHTWSLGVEEQFYLLFPFIFWFTFRPSQSGNVQRLLGLILAFSALSLTGFILLRTSAPMAAYYMMPLRFWELGFGVAAATILHHHPDGFQRASRYMPPPALILAMAALFIAPFGEKFIGHMVVVVLTTALLLVGANLNGQSRLLTNKPARYVGDISYSFYLWHWPFLTFGLLVPFSIWANPFFAVLCAFCVSALSYHFVEQPFRRIKISHPRPWHFAGALLSVLSVIAIIAAGNTYRKLLGVTQIEAALPPDFLPLPGSNLPFNPTCVVDGQNRLLQPDTFENCTFAPIAGKEESSTLWVMGDSHAGHLQGALLKLRTDYGYGVHLIETPGNTFPIMNPEGFLPRETLFKSAQDNWKSGDVVVLSRLYLSRTDPIGVATDFSGWLDKVDVLASSLAQSGIKLLLVGPPPMFLFEDVRACVPGDVESCSVDRNSLEIVMDEVRRNLTLITDRHDNAALLEIFSAICPVDTQICSPAKDGVFLFRDRDHLNTEGAALLSEYFHAALENLK
jgi:peptidoglycan/LPS O-acetylase OafA/YrhL